MESLGDEHPGRRPVVQGTESNVDMASVATAAGGAPDGAVVVAARLSIFMRMALVVGLAGIVRAILGQGDLALEIAQSAVVIAVLSIVLTALCPVGVLARVDGQFLLLKSGWFRPSRPRAVARRLGPEGVSHVGTWAGMVTFRADNRRYWVVGAGHRYANQLLLGLEVPRVDGR